QDVLQRRELDSSRLLDRAAADHDGVEPDLRGDPRARRLWLDGRQAARRPVVCGRQGEGRRREGGAASQEAREEGGARAVEGRGGVDRLFRFVTPEDGQWRNG